MIAYLRRSLACAFPPVCRKNIKVKTKDQKRGRRAPPRCSLRWSECEQPTKFGRCEQNCEYTRCETRFQRIRFPENSLYFLYKLPPEAQDSHALTPFPPCGGSVTNDSPTPRQGGGLTHAPLRAWDPKRTTQQTEGTPPASGKGAFDVGCRVGGNSPHLRAVCPCRSPRP